MKTPEGSEPKHAATLTILESTVGQILHDDLKCQLYKWAEVQNLNPHDFVSRKRACEAFIENLPQYALVFFSNEAQTFSFS